MRFRLALTDAYDRGRIICLRTTLNLDDALVRRALKEAGAKTKTEVLEMGLLALLEQHARLQLRALEGRRPKLGKVARRRPEPS